MASRSSADGCTHAACRSICASLGGTLSLAALPDTIAVVCVRCGAITAKDLCRWGDAPGLLDLFATWPAGACFVLVSPAPEAHDVAAHRLRRWCLDSC